MENIVSALMTDIVSFVGFDSIRAFVLVTLFAALLYFAFLKRSRRNILHISSTDPLGKSEEKFKLLVEAVKDYAIFILDIEGNIATWNLGAERITGYTEREVSGKHVSIFYTQKDIDQATAAQEFHAAKMYGHFEGEGERVRKDGSIYWANVVIAPLYDQAGNLSGFSKVTRDITHFKESDAHMKRLYDELERRVKARTRELEKREAQLRTITNAAPILLAQLDENQRVLFANEAFCNWFFHDQTSILNRTFQELLGEERYPANEAFIQRALSGEVTTYERASKSGMNSAILAVTFVPTKNEQNEVTGFVIVANDISKYKEIQTALKVAKEGAEVANATKSSFLANMSHEIRTPLGAVLGFSELLVHPQTTNIERATCVEVIKRNGRLLSNIINDILDLSKVEAGKLEIEKIDVHFDEVLNEMGSVLSLEASGKGVDFQVTSEGVIPTTICTDPLRLRQILLNIVGNAIKFTKRGSVRVRVKVLHQEDLSSKLAFIVKDTGDGISREQAERLFTPFTQADISTTRKFGGTGLGLALSKKLAQLLGGDVVLTESVPGVGSTFMITIDPGVIDQKILICSKSSSNETTTMSPELNADLRSLEILVVDDSSDNQALLKKILRLSGAFVDTASNGREAVEKGSTNQFHVILMDLQMPEMDGYEATAALRAQGYTKPIIALTAHAMKEEKLRTLRSGFDDHLTKPIDRDILLRTLMIYCKGRSNKMPEMNSSTDHTSLDFN